MIDDLTAEQERLEALDNEELFGEARWEAMRDDHIEEILESDAERYAEMPDDELFGDSVLETMREKEIEAQLENMEVQNEH